VEQAVGRRAVVRLQDLQGIGFLLGVVEADADECETTSWKDALSRNASFGIKCVNPAHAAARRADEVAWVE